MLTQTPNTGKGALEALKSNTLGEVATASGLRADNGVIAATLLATVNDETSSRKAKIRETAVLIRKLLSPH
jgi:hypothetical protein